ncbi:MAG TPA: vWA domain-containing protein [Kofleriaceae bacterium]|jgi:hypothetical protein
MRPLFVALALVGCSSHGHGAEAPDAAGSNTPADAPTCGGQQFDLTYVAPNLLFVVDRSCSMTKVLNGTTTTKWQAAVAAITDVLSSYGTQVRWGMTLFPDTTGDQCGQDAIPVPLGDNNGSTISTMLTDALDMADPLYPAGPCVTNIDTGLEQAATDPGLADTTRKSYMMLVTDGGQSKTCSEGGGDTGSESAVQTLEAMGVNTFVVGFGSEVKTDFLNTLAALGGEALPGATQYYQADTAGDLDMAFQAIASQVVSCEYTVSPAPPDPSQIYVWFDQTQSVPHDPTHMNGWDYDSGSQLITLYGAACDSLKTLTVTSVQLVYGCPLPPIQ